MLNGAGVWQKFNTIIMFPRSFLWLFSHLPWMRVYVVSCGMYIWLKELPSWTCSRGEWRSANVVSFYVWCHTTKRRSAWKRCAVKQQHSTVTNLECRVSFRRCWLSLPVSFSQLMPVKKLPCGESETERCRSWYPSDDWIQRGGEGEEWVTDHGPSRTASSRLSYLSLYALGLLL